MDEAAAELGYHPDIAARALSRGRSRHLGVLLTMRQPHDVALVDGIYPAAERLGYAVALGAIGPTRIASPSFVDLTTGRQDAVRMAELAVQAAAERLDHERTTPRDSVLEPTLVVRGTTAAPPSPASPAASNVVEY